MNKVLKTNKIVFIFILAFIMILISGGFTYAYFKTNSSATNTVSTSLEDDNVLSVSSFDDLYLISQYKKYNDSDLVSDDRYVIRLTDDIKLKCDIFIDLDCSIDLNGKTLYLNAHSLEVYNTYVGSNTIENGTIDAKNQDDSTDTTLGTIVINAYNQTNVINEVTFKNGDKDTVLVLLDESDPYNLYNAVYYVTNVLLNDVSKRENKLSYSEFNTKYDTTDDITFTNTDFLKTKEICRLNGGEDDTCTFISDDIDLPYSFHASNIDISYVSSDTTVLNNFGDYTAPSTYTDVTLTVNVSSDDISIKASCAFKLHVINTNDSDTLIKVGKTYILDLLSSHYDDDISKYHFTRGIELPTSTDEGITFSYKDYKDDSELDYDDQFIEVTSKVVDFEPSTDANKLEITVSAGSTSDSFTVDMLSENVANITTNTSIARKLINLWYGGGIVFTETHTSEDLTYLSSDLTSQYNITNITYELMNDTNELYEIEDEQVKVRSDSGKNPGDYVQSVMLNCIFTFVEDGEETKSQIQIPIVYNQDNGDNVDAFLLPYYTYFNDMFISNTNGGTTYNSFEMPFAYTAKGPYVVYDIAPASNVITGTDDDGNTTVEGYTYELPSFLSVSLYYDGATRQTFTYSSDIDSFTDILDQYLSDNSLTLSDIGAYDDAKWVFTIDKTKLPTTNTTVVFFYNYKFKSTSRDWALYGYNDAALTKIYMQGGLLYSETSSETSISDANLFVWIYNSFKVSGDDISTSDDLSEYIIILDWLSQNVDFDINSSTLISGITDFNGIQYLEGTRYFDITGYSLTSTTQESLLTYLPQMTWLETLKLGSTGLYDYTDTANVLSENPLNVLSTLTSLKYLDVKDDAIYDFSWLENLTSLETVYCYNNQTSSTASDFYGSTGMVNFAYYDVLIDKGVIVYYDLNANSVAVTYEGTDELNDYVRLKTVEYQSVLKSGADITNLYKNFSTNSSDYSLSSTYTHTLSWSYDGDDATTSTCFMLTDTITSGSTTIKLIIKFEVERID